MAKKSKNTDVEGVENIESVLSRTEQYIEGNQKTLLIIVGAIVGIIAIYIGYQKFVVQPKIEESKEMSFMTQIYFAEDSFALALNGDGENYGAIDIVDKYGSTKVGNLANYYAGISSLKEGQYEDAISYLEDFDSDDRIVSVLAIGAIGDANMELGNTEEALEKYLEASEMNPNDFTTPLFLLKAAQIYEFNKDYQKALEFYTKIRTEYYKTAQGRDAEKYIEKMKVLLNK